MEKLSLSSENIEPLTICICGGAGFIGMNLCSKLLEKTPHKLIILDDSSEKIHNLPLNNRIEFHTIDIKTEFSRLQEFVMKSDIIINLGVFREPADHNAVAITSTYLYESHLIAYCFGSRRLIHFSTCDVYGKTIESLLPKDSPLRENREFDALKEDASPEKEDVSPEKEDVSPVVAHRWSFASDKQFTERLILFAGTDRGLNFTIVRPFNWIGERLDLNPDTVAPCDDVPSILARFTQNLFNGERLRVVDGGHHRTTFCYIDDAIEAVLLIINNPEKANQQIFNVGNPANEISVRDLATMMMQAYEKVSNVPLHDFSIRDVSIEEFYGRAYNVTHARIPDVTNITERLGWKPQMSDLQQLLENILAYHANMRHVSGPPSKKPRIGSSSDKE
ncbi:Bifunctional polymyxin resistance protein ArnA [Euphorbia peplus]|nr:Bifunctional polymyxin resistance protein ArnA [Euphorbia peplus]